MRLSVISVLLILTSACHPVRLMASIDAGSGASDARLQSAMASEFLFQSGNFSAAFDYYRNRPLADLNAEELLRSRQIATVLGDTLWQQKADDALARVQEAGLEGMAQRFEASVRRGQSREAAVNWQALAAVGPDDAGLLAAREAVARLLPDFHRQLQETLSEFASLPDLGVDARFELFGYARQWQMHDAAQALKSGLRADSWQASMAELIEHCRELRSEHCTVSLRLLEPDGLDEDRRRNVLLIAQGNGDALQIQRWLKSLQQDSGTYYQRIVNLGKMPERTQIDLLQHEIAGDDGLSDFQRAALLGSLAELVKDWPAAQSHYRDAVADGKPGAASLRLPVVLMRQGRREQAYAALRTVQDNPVYSDEMRREAFRIEIQFNRVLRTEVSQQDSVYRRALDYWPDAHDFRFQYAMHLFDQGRIEESLSQWRYIIRQAPANAEALNAYGYTLAKELDRPRDGFKPIRKAYLLAPGQGQILDSYGYVLHRLGRDREALPFLQQAMGLMPSAETAGHLAKVYLELGRTTQAKEILDTGLELDAGNTVLLGLREHLH
jgi:tetratricopeptide (TPR) repeat protein